MVWWYMLVITVLQMPQQEDPGPSRLGLHGEKPHFNTKLVSILLYIAAVTNHYKL